MRFIALILSLYTGIAQAAYAGKKAACERAAESATDRATVVTQLAGFQLDIMLMTDEKDKALALSDLKRKLKDAVKTYGPKIRQEVAALVEKNKDKTIDEDAEQKGVEKRVRDKADKALQWTRIREHNKVQHLGPNYGEDSILTHINGELASYNLKTQNIDWQIPVTTPKDSAEDKKNFELSWKSKIVATSDGRYIVMLNPKSVQRLDVQNGKMLRLHLPSLSGYRHARLSHDERMVFFAGEDGESRIFTTADLKPILDDPGLITKYTHGKGIVQSPDGRYVFFIRNDDRHLLYDLQERKQVPMPNFEAAGFYHAFDAIFTPDSNELIILNHQKRLMTFPLGGTRLVKSRFNATGDAIHVSSDGKYVVVTRDIGNQPEGTKPFSIYKMDTGKEVKIDLTKYDFDRPNNFHVSDRYPVFFFRDEKRELGERPHFQAQYIFDFNSMQLRKYPRNPKNNLFSGHRLSADGQSIYFTSNGGPIYELY